MIAWHWYHLFFYMRSYSGHFFFHITPLGWLTLLVITTVVGYGVMRNH